MNIIAIGSPSPCFACVSFRLSVLITPNLEDWDELRQLSLDLKTTLNFLTFFPVHQMPPAVHQTPPAVHQTPPADDTCTCTWIQGPSTQLKLLCRSKNH